MEKKRKNGIAQADKLATAKPFSHQRVLDPVYPLNQPELKPPSRPSQPEPTNSSLPSLPSSVFRVPNPRGKNQTLASLPPSLLSRHPVAVLLLPRFEGASLPHRSFLASPAAPIPGLAPGASNSSTVAVPPRRPQVGDAIG